MSGLIGLVIFILIIVIIVKFILNIFKKTDVLEPQFKHAYLKKEYLLTKTEVQFFRLLEQIVKDQYYLFPQIHLASLLQVKSDERNRIGYFNRIIRKSVDFVICDKEYLKPLLAIELDDESHYRSDRQERDQFVNQALNSVGLKSLRIRVASSYNFEELKSQVLQSLL